MIVAIPVSSTDANSVGPSWGRAATVAVAEVSDGEIAGWVVHEVGWDASHDAGTHGSHHARVMRFLQEQQVDVVAAPHVGPGMVRMLDGAGLILVTGVSGTAHAAVRAVFGALQDRGDQG